MRNIASELFKKRHNIFTKQTYLMKQLSNIEQKLRNYEKHRFYLPDVALLSDIKEVRIENVSPKQTGMFEKRRSIAEERVSAKFRAPDDVGRCQAT